MNYILPELTYPELLLLLDSFGYVNSGNFPHRYKIFFKNQNSLALFDWLESIHFFDFYCSKHKRNTASLHQIVAYCFCGGWQAYLNGFVCDADSENAVELHHLSSNTFDNHPRNLQFIPKKVHNIITKATRSFNKSFKEFSNTIDTDNCICFNRKGEQIVKFKEWFKNLLLKSIILTAKFYRLTIPLKSVIQKLIISFNKYFGCKPSFILDDPNIINIINYYV